MKRILKSFKLSATACGLLLVVTCLHGASAVVEGRDDLDNCTIEGSVKDPNGAAVAGAKVELRSTLNGLTRSVVASAAGQFRFAALPPGSFDLAAESPAFAPARMKDIRVVSGQVLKLELTLQIESEHAEVTVSAPSSFGIDTTKTVAGSTLEKEFVESLPLNGRDPLDLVFLLGGVVEEPFSTRNLVEPEKRQFLRSTPEEAGNFSLNGAPAFSNNITIDGLDNNDDRSARERITLSPDAVEEFQVITNQFSAEYGRASGGRINIRTRGGSNRMQGRAFFYFQDESLNANDFFRNARGLSRLPFQRRDFGATLGGPVKRDRIFYFGSYERDTIPDQTTIDTLLPASLNKNFPLPLPNAGRALVDPSGVAIGRYIVDVSTPQVRNLGTARADVYQNARHNFEARFDIVRELNERQFRGGNRLQETINSTGRNTESYALIDNLILSPSAVSQTRLQFSRLAPGTVPISKAPVVLIRIAGNGGDLVAGSGTSGSTARTEDRFQFQHVMSLVRGRHALKLGADLQFLSATFEDFADTSGVFTFDTPANFLANAPDRFERRFNTRSTLDNKILGFFFQDDLRIRPSFTLGIGIRYDTETIVHDRNNFSPRLAFAWAPGKAGKTLVRGGFGLFYNRALLRTLDDFAITTGELSVDSKVTPQLLGLVHFPDPSVPANAVSAFGIPSTFLRVIGPQFEIPYTEQANLGGERQFGKNLVIEFNYNYTRGVHLWRETNANAPVLPGRFASFTEYLLSRDFDNRPDSTGKRPIASSNADVVRFVRGASNFTTTEFGIRIFNAGLDTSTSANITTALNAIRPLRPNPAAGEIEQLESTGNSFYHGGTISVRYRMPKYFSFRASYTLSKFIDEGTTNTASAFIQTDRRADRALSTQDQRHRFVLSGVFNLPRVKLDVSPILIFGSSKPFNIGTGIDRNLNDISNDRPLIIGPLSTIRWRRPASLPSSAILSSLAVAPIGSNGDLPRNFGRGPGTRTINVRFSRRIRLTERTQLLPQVDVFNLFNNSIFSFGSEFIDRSDADFLTPRRVQKSRQIQLSLRLDF